MTHYQFGVLVEEKVHPSVRKIINQNQEMFYWGLQGPDILFFYRPYAKNPISNIGRECHVEHAKEFLSHIFEIRDLENTSTTSYILGMCCHYILDKNLHPLVWKYGPTSKEHQKVESSLERLTMNRFHIAIKRYKLLPQKNIDLSALQNVYRAVSVKQLGEAVRTGRYVARLLDFKIILQIYELLLQKKDEFASLCVPKQVEVKVVEELLPLFDASIEEAMQLIVKYVDDKTTKQQFLECTKWDFNGDVH